MNRQQHMRSGDLAVLERTIWEELARAVRVKPDAAPEAPPHPWRQAVLASQSADGPQARTVVLRDLRHEPRELVFYSDARAGKVRELRADPRVQLVCWSPALGWQLRLQGRAQVETDGLDVTARWAAIRHRRAAQDYLAPLPPGAPLDAPAYAAGLQSEPRMDDDPKVPRHHFAVVYLSISSLDWLELHPEGHRRARFEAGAPARWLTP